MAPTDTSSKDKLEDHTERIRQIVEDAMRRRQAGEVVDDEHLVGAHPDLMPELGEELATLAMIQQARQRAAQTMDVGPSQLPLVDEPEFAALMPEALPDYQIINEIHRGGQGVVYKAVQRATKRTVAVKVLPHGPLASARDRHYFEREVELAAGLRHPNIVTVYESGVAQGRYYFAMEYIDGEPLDQHVRSSTLTLRQMMGLFAKVCDAVAYAHQRGIIHRDLKPSNILVDADGEPRVVDFGLAKSVDSPGTPPPVAAAASITGQIIGTLAYMSPEQASGRPADLDVRTDVYSLGVILYNLLTGQFPYDVQGELLDVLQNIREAEPFRLARIVPRLDSDVQTIVLKALEKEPDRRYQSATELHYDVKCWLQGLPIVAKSTSSLYVLRKLMVRHWYVTTVAALLSVIVLGFGYISFDFYLQARKAADKADRRAQASLETSQRLQDMSAAAARQNTVGWFLDAWHQGWSAEARTSAKMLPKDCREKTAVSFLLDPKPLTAKVAAFRQELGQVERGFAEYFIAEHHLRDGNVPEAIEAYRRCVQASKAGWCAVRARVRLQTLTQPPKPPTTSSKRDGSK